MPQANGLSPSRWSSNWLATKTPKGMIKQVARKYHKVSAKVLSFEQPAKHQGAQSFQGHMHILMWAIITRPATILILPGYQH
jgi:hypothetical protein